MASNEGKFVWYELMTTDMAAAERFYTSVVGWTAADAGMPDMKFTLLSAGDRHVAGLMDTPEPDMKPLWIGYIFAADIDAKVKEVAARGGTVHRPPTDIPGIGRFAVVADPHGVSFCLFSSNTEDEPPPMTTPGHIGWHELMGGDLDSSWTFYSALFGWTKDQGMDMGDMGVYQLFAAQGEVTGAMMTKSAEVPFPYWGFYFNVDAIDAAVERVTAGGGHVINGPMKVPGGSWIVNGVDPQGAIFALVAPKR